MTSNSRRDFLIKSASTLTAGAVVTLGLASKNSLAETTVQPSSRNSETDPKVKEEIKYETKETPKTEKKIPQVHTLPALGYAYDALEPYIDKETMLLHHTKHHQSYVDGLNKTEELLTAARQENNFSAIQDLSKKLAFFGGGHFLHTLFWEIMASPKQGGGVLPMSGSLLKAITRDFGTLESFKAQFSAAALTVEGSGWALLHVRKNDGKLLIMQAENQHKLSSWGVTPILGIDVWEHAYYLKYNNRRNDYISAWWNVVNWSKVQELYQVEL